MDLFHTLFQHQMKLLNPDEDLWIPYLIGALPRDVTSLNVREPEKKCREQLQHSRNDSAMVQVNRTKILGFFHVTEKAQMGQERIIILKSEHILKAKGNRIHLGTYFLSSAGLILDACWYFWNISPNRHPFGEELDFPSIDEKMSISTYQLREAEGESLISAKKEKLNFLLESFQNVFEPGAATILH
ncbi:hypothetical protein TNCV_904881 [Trichonephila clavipes]|nr:hypothetical protein TNCV_904881 [Trichonephila clavipes]